MAVKLQLAYNQTGQLVFIKERLEKNQKYFCPHCREEVFPRKGNLREHHFFHKKGSDCAAAYETILHFEIKHYIAKQIEENNGQHISLLQLGK